MIIANFILRLNVSECAHDSLLIVSSPLKSHSDVPNSVFSVLIPRLDVLHISPRLDSLDFIYKEIKG